MATVTCECGNEYPAGLPACPLDGIPRPRTRLGGAPVAPVDPPEPVEPVDPSAPCDPPEPVEPVDPSVPCDHSRSDPGIICSVCLAPKAPLAAPARGRVELAFPWTVAVLAPEEVLELGRGVGPLQHQLVPYPTVSNRHAELRVTRGGELIVKDMSSTNGTWVGDERIDPGVERMVFDGDVLHFSRALPVIVRVLA